MADEFLETDLDTPTETDLDLAYGSRFLGVEDVGSRKVRTRVLKVRKEEIKERDTGRPKMRFVVYFESVDKPLVLNPTNKNILVDALGKSPAAWIGATVGIFVDPNVTFAGKRTGGVRLRVLLPPATKAPIPKKPAPTKPATEWSEQEGDPGFDPDVVKDFEPTI